ncbi:class I SAM-dependent methyltransferase (plasmid) [Skermanella sp. TT6]|uniref:Class I SAM-dependent methyltransferase n=1 Tax=Skermanella cutis TaxID=2775420 RepID=A0ABX7BFQ3_9PROT|nr:class I SAM-dependent methyltransferase [Skermanella sp. TT6]QQP92903.1 class I SAM-dependent methyltransferase [Skermanella sp. TT6]
MDTTGFSYAGSELELFRSAERWKTYWGSRLGGYVTGRVLEVGAGIGGTTEVLVTGRAIEWVCLEPDPALSDRLRRSVDAGRLPDRCRVVTGTVADLGAEDRFDTVLYIDVLEHIEDDRAELARAAARLEPGGHLIVLAPAHQFLFTAFDREIGHYRRYDRKSLLALEPPGLRMATAFYLDSVGMLASLGNRLLLRSSMPTAGQIRLWDRMMVPLSRGLDPLLRRSLGKTVVAIWTAP